MDTLTITDLLTDLMRFGWVVALAILWYWMSKMDGKMDSLGNKFDSLLTNVVTKSECANIHANLWTAITAILGVSNCKNCRAGQHEDK